MRSSFFCLVTGYYLNDKREDDKLFFNKIFVYLRILLLSVIVYLILALFEGVDVEIPSLKILALYNSFGFINAPHLWYLLALIISLSIIHLLKKMWSCLGDIYVLAIYYNITLGQI